MESKLSWEDYFKLADKKALDELAETSILIDHVRNTELEPDIAERKIECSLPNLRTGFAAFMILLFQYTRQDCITCGLYMENTSDVISFSMEESDRVWEVQGRAETLIHNAEKVTAILYNPFQGEVCVDFAFIFNGKKITLLYDKNIWDESSPLRIERHYCNIVSYIAGEDNCRVLDIDFTTMEEKKLILQEFNKCAANYPKKKTVVTIFEEQVEMTPDNIAVVYENESITYGELNNRANAVAEKLREMGVKPCDFVAILAERSIEMIIGIYGIVKSGGAYVPINTEYPMDRIHYIINDCKPMAILAYRAETSGLDVPVVNLGEDEFVKGKVNNPIPVNRPEDILYVIYTSGTTGNPKGVMIEHRNLVRLLFNSKFQFDFNCYDVWTMFHSFCFDFSVWEMYGATLYGGKLVVVSKETAKNGQQFLELIVKEKVTVLNQVPSSFYNLMSINRWDEKDSIRYLIFGGEALSPKRLKQWKATHPKVKIVNMYGITETTVHVTYKDIGELEIEKGISDIGGAIPTLGVYVMNQMHLCGIGVPGELCVAGEGLARGYLNLPELTKEKFVQNPYGEGRLYRSGDLARWMPDGNIEYLGRIDQQVKIRGFRIELGEIETGLCKHKEIKQVAVVLKEMDGKKAITAYITARRELSVGELRTFLKDKLPYYMLPAYYVQLDSIPTNHNGKLDKKALPDPVGKMQTGAGYQAPSTKEEETLVEIWEELLQVSQVSLLDNFFDLGGDSLLAVIACTMAKNNGIDLEVTEMFQGGSIKKILNSRGEAIHNQFELVENLYNMKELENLKEIKGKDFITEYKLGDYKSKAELPAVAQNEITTYLHRSLPLCAILANDNYIGWYYSNYIQIFSYRDAKDFLDINYLEPRDSFAEIADVICLGYHLLQGVESIVDFIKEKIQLGYYLILNLDEYELSNKHDYRRNHYVHASIVYGYDDETRKVKGVGFDKSRLFTDLLFDYDELNKAYTSSKRHYLNYAPWCAWSAVQLIKLKSPERQFPFSKRKFMEDLYSYLHSEPDEYRLYNFEYDVNRVTFGMEVYETLVKELHNILRGEFHVDYRALHLLAEHKKCLYVRLNYVIEKNDLGSELIKKKEEFYQLVLKFDELRKQFLGQVFQEFNLQELSNEQKRVIENVSNEIMLLKEVEYKLLNEIYELLNRKFGG
jgi:amino acid adenylation domain-containing protein